MLLNTTKIQTFPFWNCVLQNFNTVLNSRSFANTKQQLIDNFLISPRPSLDNAKKPHPTKTFTSPSNNWKRNGNTCKRFACNWPKKTVPLCRCNGNSTTFPIAPNWPSINVDSWSCTIRSAPNTVKRNNSTPYTIHWTTPNCIWPKSCRCSIQYMKHMPSKGLLKCYTY